MRNSTWKRMISAFLAMILFFSNFNQVFVFAETVPTAGVLSIIEVKAKEQTIYHVDNTDLSQEEPLKYEYEYDFTNFLLNDEISVKMKYTLSAGESAEEPVSVDVPLICNLVDVVCEDLEGNDLGDVLKKEDADSKVINAIRVELKAEDTYKEFVLKFSLTPEQIRNPRTIQIGDKTYTFSMPALTELHPTVTLGEIKTADSGNLLSGSVADLSEAANGTNVSLELEYSFENTEGMKAGDYFYIDLPEGLGDITVGEPELSGVTMYRENNRLQFMLTKAPEEQFSGSIPMSFVLSSLEHGANADKPVNIGGNTYTITFPVKPAPTKLESQVDVSIPSFNCGQNGTVKGVTNPKTMLEYYDLSAIPAGTAVTYELIYKVYGDDCKPGDYFQIVLPEPLVPDSFSSTEQISLDGNVLTVTLDEELSNKTGSIPMQFVVHQVAKGENATFGITLPNLTAEQVILPAPVKLTNAVRVTPSFTEGTAGTKSFDLSGVARGTEVTLLLSCEINHEASAKPIKAGDYFQITLPENFAGATVAGTEDYDVELTGNVLTVTLKTDVQTERTLPVTIALPQVADAANKVQHLVLPDGTDYEVTLPYPYNLTDKALVTVPSYNGKETSYEVEGGKYIYHFDESTTAAGVVVPFVLHYEIKEGTSYKAGDYIEFRMPNGLVELRGENQGVTLDGSKLPDGEYYNLMRIVLPEGTKGQGDIPVQFHVPLWDTKAEANRPLTIPGSTVYLHLPVKPHDLTDKVEAEIDEFINGEKSYKTNADGIFILSDLNAGDEVSFEIDFSIPVDTELKKTDYFTFTLPKYYENLEIRLPEGSPFEAEKVVQEDGSYRITVKLKNDPTTEEQEADLLTGTIPFSFTVPHIENRSDPGRVFDVQLPGQTSFQMMFPYNYQEPDKGKFTVEGKIEHNEHTDSSAQDWTELLRPDVFDMHRLEVIQTYVGADGKDHEVKFSVQDDLAKENYYVTFIHDGQGGGDFTVENVPNTITVDGVKYQVVTTRVVANMDDLPYYRCDNAIVADDPTNGVTVNGTLNIKLNTQKVTLNPEIIPETEDTAEFTYHVTYTNPNRTVTDENGVTKPAAENRTYTVSNKAAQVIDVPVGLEFSAVQTEKNGYRLETVYDVNGEESEAKAEGTVGDTPITITTTNFARNVSVSVAVDWIDNNDSNRPEATAALFVLQYKTENGDWISVDENSISQLGLTSVPACDMEQAKSNKFSFHALPHVDAEGKPVEYRVKLNEAVLATDAYQNYVVDREAAADGQHFVISMNTPFQATIVWNDSDDHSHRPAIDDYAGMLHLYRHLEDSDEYEEITDIDWNDCLTESESYRWTVSIPGLEKYNSENAEYDYVLVQGTIENGNINRIPIAGEGFEYRTFYSNSSGTNTSDYSLCHLNGKIIQMYAQRRTFHATKVWKDDGSEKTIRERPTPTITFWRYLASQATGIDDAYTKGLASPVVIMDGEGNEHILQYTLDPSSNTEIGLWSTLADGYGLPSGYMLPGYDSMGRRYVYFIRETLPEEATGRYAISYSQYVNGATDDETITNTRREKAAINVSKVWKMHSDLGDAEDSSVVLEIKAATSDNGELKPLQIYSSEPGSYEVLTGEKLTEAITATGFTSLTPSSEITYYANIYDENGIAFDMANAVITETVISKTGTQYTEGVDNEDGRRIVTIGDKTYAVQTSCLTPVGIDGGSATQYRYQQTNTITAIRTYALEKEWSTSIAESHYNDIKYIRFKLYRRPTGNNSNINAAGSAYEFLGYFQIPAPANPSNRIWSITIGENPLAQCDDELGPDYDKLPKNAEGLVQLPQYDEEGFEYLYKATEYSFVRADSEVTVEQATGAGGGQNFTDDNGTVHETWSNDHYYTPDQTRVVNYKTVQGHGYFSVMKSWLDNGDTAHDSSKVHVRIFKRSELKEWLEENYSSANDAQKIDIKDFESVAISYKPDPLEKDNHYTRSINMETLVGNTTSADDAYNWKNYIVLEYAVEGSGDDSANLTTAKYTYGDLKQAVESTNMYTVSGTVENANRKYQIYIESDVMSHAQIIITNTRVGEITLNAEKVWKDEGNSLGMRSAIHFQLYQDGEPYHNIPDSVAVSGVGNVKAELNRVSGIITVSPTAAVDNASSWQFEVKGLQMFTESGTVHAYNMDEAASDSRNPNVYYLQKKVETKVSASDSKAQTYSFRYENTITGLTSHVAYKYWKDSMIDGHSPERPDLFFKLYRYRVSEHTSNPQKPLEELASYDLFTDYDDQIWTAWEAHTESDDESNYNWKITATGLPMFSENGEQWGYVFVEEMGNKGNTVYGTYVCTSETKTRSDGSTYEVFTNTIQDTVKVSGLKTWSGLSGYVTLTKDQLPDPDLILYRTTDEEIKSLQELTDNVITNLIRRGKLEMVDSTKLDATKKSYSFPSDAYISNHPNLLINEGDEWYLPKYDREGKVYTYLVREVIEDPISSQLYNQFSTSGTLSNQFREDTNRRQITVSKSWSGWENFTLSNLEKKYHSVTYKLYRYEFGDAFCYDVTNPDSTAKLIETHTFSASQLAGSNGNVSYTFEDLLYFSPTGKQYGYFIEETDIDGYRIVCTDETAIVDGTAQVYDGWDKETNTIKLRSLTESERQAMISNEFVDIVSLPESWNTVNNQEVSSGTQNVYDRAGTLELHGTKHWNDYGGLEGIRPGQVEFKLYRYTASEAGQSNGIPSYNTVVVKGEADAKDPYIVWNYKKGDGTVTSNTEDAANATDWLYTIYNLQRYAPNGMPYIYTLEEVQDSEKLYVSNGNSHVASKEVVEENNHEKVTMDVINNDYTGTYYVRKNWKDGENKYRLRPKSITVVLEWSKDDGKTWEKITADKFGGESYPHTIEIDGTRYIGADGLKSKTTEGDFTVVDRTAGASWECTFEHLPQKSMVGDQKVAILYRAEEIFVGDTPITEKTDENGKTILEAGAYVATHVHTADGKSTVIENKMQSTSLTVTKIWQGDSDNAYYSRPAEIRFKLEQYSLPLGENQNLNMGKWETVMDDDGVTPLEFVLNEANGWTMTLKDLPVAKVEANPDVVRYNLYFRAVEICEDGSPADAKNYKELTAYPEKIDSAEHYNDTSLNPYHYFSNGNFSNLTNELITDEGEKIAVTKHWNRIPGDTVTATFELLWSNDEGETKTWHCFGEGETGVTMTQDQAGNLFTSSDWSAHTEANHCVVHTSTSIHSMTESFVWEKLPTVDKDGKTLYYRVIEHPVEGYKTEGTETTQVGERYPHAVEFINTELKNYTVEKVWQKSKESAADADGNYTATFKLQSYVIPKSVKADQYTYTDNPYSYTGKRVVEGTSITTYYTSATVGSGAANVMNDFARYMGALYHSGVSEITYGGTTYTWNENGTLKGSNWVDASNNTLVSKVVTDMGTNGQSGTLAWDGTNYTYSYCVDSDDYDSIQPTAEKYVPVFTDVEGIDPITITISGDSEETTGSDTWYNLPIYTASGEEIVYRAVETHINGIPVENNNNRDYIVTYGYDGGSAVPTFEGTKTTATNRMVYGFVNMSKTAAYLDPGVHDLETRLQNVTFAIYKKGVSTPYVSNIKTDANGNLLRNEDGTYGYEHRYLITGEYTLKESTTNPEYAIWDSNKGVDFKIGLNTTGEHGTAWISTQKTIFNAIFGGITLTCDYKPCSGDVVHSYGDSCAPTVNDNSPAYNIESRGVLTFTKTGPNGAALDIHAGAEGEASAYFGVYLDAECTKQVAGMVPSGTDKTNFILTNKKLDGSDLPPLATVQGGTILYLREFTDANYAQYPFTLLTGTYYIKELVAPAGYRLDTDVRTVEIPKIKETTENTDLSSLYPNNQAKINGGLNYQWENTPNVVTLYKIDQYGRQVTLTENGYLELTISGTDAKFPTGETTIQLYQDAAKPATKTDGTPVANYVRYDAAAKKWIFTGLFATNGQVYTLTEPNNAVPANNIVARDFKFTVDPAGTIVWIEEIVTEGDKTVPTAKQQENVLQPKTGSDFPDNFLNAYHPGAAENQIVLRDVSRYLKDITLLKIETNSNPQKPIENISFKLYKYETVENGEPKNSQAVLGEDIYLTTDNNGRIVLSEQPDSVQHMLIPGSLVKYGLDIGNYYFEEVERGASDAYRLSERIFFEITPNEGHELEYGDYAKVAFKETDHIQQKTDVSNGKPYGLVSNDPVYEAPKTLLLHKQNEDGTVKLSNTHFKLEYRSVTNEQAGSQNTAVIYCMTDVNGELYETDADWNYKLDGEEHKIKPDISRKGEYILTEVLAHSGNHSEDLSYITPTAAGTDTPITIVKFRVTSDNKIEKISNNGLASDISIGSSDTGEHTSYNATVKNNKTAVAIAKRNDIENGTKTKNQKSLNGELITDSTLEMKIFAGETLVATLNSGNGWKVAEGVLKENTEYVLKETVTPVGYLTANPITFKIFGTATNGKSQLYVKNGDSWNKTTNIKDNTLTMVDEVVIAPVTLSKVVGTADENKALPRAIFEVAVTGGAVIGTAITTENSIVWQTVTAPSDLVFTTDGTRVTEANKAAMNGQTIILMQNAAGYTFREIYAPDHAYNDGKSYTVKITADDYRAYKANFDYRVDILREHMFDPAVAKKNESNVLVNPSYQSTVWLCKYDADEESRPVRKEIPNTEFTLYRVNGNGTETVYTMASSKGSVVASGKFLTDGEGKLTITIPEKGTYVLRETAAATGYKLDNNNFVKFTLQDKATDADRAAGRYGYNETNQLKRDEDDNGFPNDREMGLVTLVKKDKDSGKLLDGVVYKLTRTDPPDGSPDYWLNLPDVGTVVTGKAYEVVKGETSWKLQEVSGGESGTITITGLNWGSYKLVEQEETDGYKLDTKELTFVVKASSLIIAVQDNGKDFVTNTKNQLTVQKLGAQNEAQLSGAEFKLYRVTETEGGLTAATEATGFYAQPQDIDKAESTVITAGKTTIYGLPKGTYVLRETKAPDGYEIARDVIFDINETGDISSVYTCGVDSDGKITKDDAIESTDHSNLFVEQSDTTLTVRDNPIRVQLDKALKDNISLTGRGDAKFTITGEFANPTASVLEFTGNTISTALDARLIAGKSYTVKETEAPLGYEIPGETEVVQFYVNTDGTVTVTSGEEYLSKGSVENGVAQMTFTDKPIELHLSKVDENGNTIPEATLGYAQFTVTGKMFNPESNTAEEKTFEGLTTQIFKESLSDKLIAKETYTVTETFAPNGYKLTSTFRFTVDEYGNISAILPETETGTFADAKGVNSDTLTVTNHPNKVTFVKVETGTTYLAGASFELTAVTPEDGTTPSPAFVNLEKYAVAGATATNVTMGANSITWTSAAVAEGFTLTNHLIAGVTYQLKETNRVANHEQILEPITFRVNLDGTLIISSNPAIPNNPSMPAAEQNGIQMTIRNPAIKGSVVLTKYKRNDTTISIENCTEKLEGAVYVLKQVGDKNHSPITPVYVNATQADNVYTYSSTQTTEGTRFETNADGVIIVYDLPEGNYEFHEVDAPDAYHINKESGDQPVAFRIENSTLAHVEHAKDVDTAIKASIQLTKYSGEALRPNAVFKVEYKGTHETVFSAWTTPEITTDENGYAALTDLPRGTYRLTELSAPGQIMNTMDGNKTRNTIEFVIGNEIGKVYVIKSGTDVTYTIGGKYIELTEKGVVDYPIPNKSVTVNKSWINDAGMDKTFRPESITVQLQRSYDNRTFENVVDYTAELNAENSWLYTWENLPAYVNVPEDGKDVTYLYTYRVVETNKPSWYMDNCNVDDTYTTESQNTKETTVKDGNTTAAVENTLIGGDKAQELKITKALGGGTAADTFYVRVKLTKNSDSVGNTGYYLDPCATTGTAGTVTPDTDGWMEIHGGETITVKLPMGVTYEVEEKSEDNAGGTAAVEGSAYEYTIRYDATQTGTIETTDAATTIRNVAHKHIELAKFMPDGETALTGAEYKVKFNAAAEDGLSNWITNSWTEKTGCTVNADGKLVDSGDAVIDITAQGTYEIYETKAPEGYITPTDKDGKPICLAIITVDENDTMSVAVDSGNNGYAAALITDGKAKITSYGTVADIMLINNPVEVYIGKTIDYAEDQQTDAQEGKYLSSVTMQIIKGSTVIYQWETGSGNKKITLPGVYLQENVIYTLHEVDIEGTRVPTGYKQAADVQFKLDGTYSTEEGKRYSRIILVDEAGKPIDQNTAGNVYGKAGVIDGQLNMVDETIIAPVNLQKVLKISDTKWDAVSGVQFAISDDTTVFGVAETDSNGYLNWKTIQNVTDANGNYLLYNADGRIIESTGAFSGRVILRENVDGYTLTETYAPDHVYNDGRTYSVTVTEDMYNAYRTDSTASTELYKTNTYFNVVEADKTQTEYSDTKEYTNPDSETLAKLAENLPFKAQFLLYKYDADHNGRNADNLYTVPGMKGVQFTLKKMNEDYTVTDTSQVFTTRDGGLLTIPLTRKGYYELTEVTPAGYVDNPIRLRFQVTDEDYQHTLTYDADNANTRHIKTLLDHMGDTFTLSDGNAGAMPYPVANNRQMGSVTLTKTDAESGQPLNGVKYELYRVTPAKNEFVDNYVLVQSAPLIVETGKTYKGTVDTMASGAKAVSAYPETGSNTDGVLKIENLPWGDYVLVEVQELSGYMLEKDNGDAIVNTYSFTIRASNPEQKDVSDNQTNYKNRVTFYKTNVTDTEAGVTALKPLQGAVFQVHSGETCNGECTPVSFYANASDKSLKDDGTDNRITAVTSGADGKVTIYGLPTEVSKQETTYHLVETVAPKGYKIQEPVVFSMDRQGVVWVENTIKSNVTMQDEPIKVYITKLGEGTNVLTGAEFELTDTCTNCDNAHKLANDALSETITVTGEKTLIPIERLIGGHTYTLTETKAPDGYECTAVVTFTVNTYGKITESLITDSNYHVNDKIRAVVEDANGNPVIKIHNELIRATLTKVDFTDANTKLSGVTYQLIPKAGSSFGIKEDGTPYTEASYSAQTVDGQLVIPAGLMKYGNTYLLQETAAISGYYLSNGAQAGVEITVDKSGKMTLAKANEAYEMLTEVVNETDVNGVCQLLAKNYPTTSFDLTKLVEGNMGDLTAEFQIKLKLSEPDGSPISPKSEETVTLKFNQKYDSEHGVYEMDGTTVANASKAFDAIPVGATVVISENDLKSYTATIRTTADNKITETDTNDKNSVQIKLNSKEHVSIQLVNTLEVPINVGVSLEGQTPLAFIALIIPVLWLGYRYKKKRMGGDLEE